LLNRALQLLVAAMRTLFLRLSLAIGVAAAAAAATSCDRRAEGVVHVIVIGDQPKLSDPQLGALSKGDAVLVDNVAQGLVRLDARGQVEPGLAETWNVSDDGLSYIFRLANGDWPDGRKITADQVARMLRRMALSSNEDPLRDSFGAIDDIVAMTDRVIEIQLKQPRPHLLQLLAQPQMGLVYEGQGTGPFTVDREKSRDGVIRLSREVAVPDEERSVTEELDLSGAKAGAAIRAFLGGQADLVLGGTFADLPLATHASLPRRALRFDPAAGLFGLIPTVDSGPVADSDVRALLSAAIDRDALVATLSVPGLVPRATVLEPGLDNIPDPVAPNWATTPFTDRKASLAAEAKRLFGSKPPTIRLALPEGPGSDILFGRLSQDWGVLGIEVERAEAGGQADLKLVDEVAPSTSPAWFVRHFRCSAVPVCDKQVDDILEGARDTVVLAQRSALFNEASRRIDSQQLFIPIAAPIRWSLVSARIAGFAGNRFAIHTLTGLEQPLNRTGE
jgi:peptide/nickel transport system substrate-binding protein